MKELEMEPVRYEIRRIYDFLSVPPERREAMLKEFALALEFMDFAGCKDADASFVWVDDGERNVWLEDSKTGETFLRLDVWEGA